MPTIEHGYGYLTTAREHIEIGEFTTGLSYIERAITTFVEHQEWKGVVHALADMVNCRRHQAEAWECDVFKTFCRTDADAMMSCFTDFKVIEQAHLVHYRMATFHQLNEDWNAAATDIREALRSFHGLEAQRSDWQIHLGYAQWRSGKKDQGLQMMRLAYQLLCEQEVTLDYPTRRTWKSGGLLKLAEAHWEADNRLAREQLRGAEELITQSPHLRLRKRELTKLKTKLGI